MHLRITLLFLFPVLALGVPSSAACDELLLHLLAGGEIEGALPVFGAELQLRAAVCEDAERCRVALCAAYISAVLPLELAALTSAPAASRASTTAVLRAKAASSSGVICLPFVAATLAPRASSACTAARCPPAAAEARGALPSQPSPAASRSAPASS